MGHKWPQGGARGEFIFWVKTKSDISHSINCLLAPPCGHLWPIVYNTVSKQKDNCASFGTCKSLK
jgi:hypothetical protein